MPRLLSAPKTQSRLLRLWVLGLALVLLLSQSLGQLHAVKHDWSANHHHAVHETRVAYSGDGFLELLFSSHNSDSDCRLFDQLSGGHAMPSVALIALPVVLPSLLYR